MSYLISNLVISLIATFLLGLLVGWFFWGRLKNKIQVLEVDWRNRYMGLDNEYKSIAKEFTGLEQELNKKATHISALNNEKNEVIGQLNASKSLLQDADTEIDELKNQLGQTTARFHVTNKELDKRKEELNALREAPSEAGHLKTLLGEATKRYNNNGLELKNKQEEFIALQNKFDETKKRTESLNKELELLRTKLLKRDKEFENQIVAFSNLQNELNEKNTALLTAQADLDTHKSDNQELAQRDKKITALRSELSEFKGLRKSVESKLESREIEISALQQKLQQERKRIPNLENQIVDTKKRIPMLENTIKLRDASIAALETEVTTLSKEIPPLRDNLDKRNEQIMQLEQEVNTLQQKIPAFRSTISARDAHIRELENFIKDAQKAILKPASRTVALNGNGNGAANGNGYSHKNEKNNNNVVHINGNNNGTGNGIAKTNGVSKPTLVTQTNSLNAKSQSRNSTKRKIKSYGLEKPIRKPDDLKLISGVGVTLEKTLHKCGIYFFEQIAGFTRKDVAAVDDMLKFKGRIDRDEWVKQAKILLRGGTYTRKKSTQKNAPRKRRMKSLGMKRPAGELDDLQLINGVGPKLERKLHRLGIYHFEQIAGFTAEDIELVDSKLKTYKGRVKRYKWPMQARRLHKEFHLNT